MLPDLIDARLRQLATQLQSLSVQDAALRLDAIAGYLQDFHRDFDFGAFLRLQLFGALDGTREVLTQRDRIEIASSAHGSVFLGPVHADGTRMYLTSRRTALVVVGDPVQLEVFSLDDALDPDVLLDAAVLQPRGSVSLRDGDSHHFDGYRTLVHASVSGSSMLLRYESEPRAHYRWVFDRASLASIGWIPTDLALLDRVDLFEIAAAVGDAESQQQLLAATADRSHLVRWAAAGALIRMQPQLGLETMQRLAASDPHPDLRQSAADELAGIAEAHAHGA